MIFSGMSTAFLRSSLKQGNHGPGESLCRRWPAAENGVRLTAGSIRALTLLGQFDHASMGIAQGFDCLIDLAALAVEVVNLRGGLFRQ